MGFRPSSLPLALSPSRALSHSVSLSPTLSLYPPLSSLPLSPVLSLSRARARAHGTTTLTAEPPPQPNQKQVSTQAAVDALLQLEKTARLAEDGPGAKAAALAVVELLHAAKAWDSLNEHVSLLAKKRSQLKMVVQGVVRAAAGWVDGAPAEDGVRERLVDTLLSVTEGKIYVEIDRARLTRARAAAERGRGRPGRRRGADPGGLGRDLWRDGQDGEDRLYLGASPRVPGARGLCQGADSVEEGCPEGLSLG